MIAHTAASKLLADDPLMREWIGMVSEELWPAASKARPTAQKILLLRRSMLTTEKRQLRL